MIIIGANPWSFGYIVGMEESEIVKAAGMNDLPGNMKIPGAKIVVKEKEDTAVREHAYKNVLKILAGFRKAARDNTLSAHAVVTDIAARIQSEIDHPSM